MTDQDETACEIPSDQGVPAISRRALLELVISFAKEQYPGKTFPSPIPPNAALDKDLGFDSLGQMELLSRIEAGFGVTLSEEAFIKAGTLEALFDVVLAASSGATISAKREGKTRAVASKSPVPHQAETLQEVLDWHLERQHDRPHVYLYGDGVNSEPFTYAMLNDGARKVAEGLLELGLKPRETVAIMLPTGKGYLYSFLGILLAGGVPVPIYPPARPSQIEEHLHRHAGILGNAHVKILITVPEANLVAQLLRSQAGLAHVVTVDALFERAAGGTVAVSPQASDLAFLQYTSGSTGNPKGVMLTHDNLLANLRAMGEAARVRSDDIFVSWLPLYHDMGLIGAWLGSLYFGFPLVLMSPLTFLARPQRWLRAIHNHRGTLSAAPNFAYELCLNKLKDSDIEDLDLSSWRMAFNGAEPVSARTVRRFINRFGPYGFRPETMAPVFGLAESSVGLAFPPLDRKPPIERISRQALTTSGKAIIADDADETALEFVACGQALKAHELRVVDSGGRALPDRREGHLQFRGPSATRGYFRKTEETQSLFDGEWLNTGDLAYLSGGDLYITSRVKDLIIRAGRNIYPYHVEEAVGEIEGVRKGCVALFGVTDEAAATERLVILAETREKDRGRRGELSDKVAHLATDILGMPPDEVVMAPPHSVLKTSSGKIRRSACREMYEKGVIGQTRRAVWLQIVRLALSGLFSRMRRAATATWDYLYAAYIWVTFGILTTTNWLAVAVLPTLSSRWWMMRRLARLMAWLAGISIEVRGAERVPDAEMVLVSNHASYVDAILLAAVLPHGCRYIAKGEFRNNFFARFFLQRTRSEFVERIDKQQSLADARRLETLAHGAYPLLFFPEGTFADAPGLLPFRMGAFTIAAKAGLPVVPIAIRGSRSLMRGRSWFPRRGALEVTFGEPLYPSGSDWKEMTALRNGARETILRHCGEPDRGTS